MISVIILLVVVGVALYLLKLVPMDETVRKVITVLVILLVVLYALQVLGVIQPGDMPRLR